MKAIKILQAVLLVTIVSLAASCSTSREYRNRPYSSSGVGFSLIVNPAPGLIVRVSNGRYYYRDHRGYIYWRGYGNRYYLDRRYMSRSYYHHHQYNDWKRHHNYRHR
ncbi:MAG TPA: hypothetical protein VI461_15755 [Chitinophagaceae bacterium]|nr:hypothetical protein [Chitinophagaceae bacterium]